MDPRDLLHAIRRSWWLVALVVALCVGAAAAYTSQQEPVYRSHTQLFVAAQAPRPDLEATYQGGLFTTQRVQSYARVARSEIVTAPVVRELGLSGTAEDLSERITAVAPPETVLIDLAVEGRTADEAQRVARAVARRFVTTIERLETPSQTRSAPVRLSISVPATRPSARVSPRTTLNIAASLVLGLLLGLLAAVVRARLDTRIGSPAELPAVPGAVLLGGVPSDKAADRVTSTDLRGLPAPLSEALRRVRTNLRFVDLDHPPRSIVVTSAMPGEGKTTVSVGLAMAMADAGADVILVEGDLRAPRLAESLGLLRNPGVAGHLVSETPVDRLLEGWPAGREGGRLRVLAAGAVPPNPSELLGSQRMRALLADLRERADIVLIDAPPLLPVTDAAVLATAADGVLLVVRMGMATRPAVERAHGTLDRVHARVLGIVANAVTSDASTYSRPDLHPAGPPAGGSPNGTTRVAGAPR